MNFFADDFFEGAAATMQAAKSINTNPILIRTNLQIFVAGNFLFYEIVEDLKLAD